MRILIILASGIGNSILFGPTLKAIRNNLKDAVIDVFAYKKVFAEPFTGSKLVDNFIYYDGFSSLLKLRNNKYDISITAFPSNRWEFNVFAFLIGAKKRITHSYKVGQIRTLSFLQNCKVPADEKLHDIEQNLKLLNLLKIKKPTNKKPVFHLEKEDVKFAKEYIKKSHINGLRLIGVHAGSGPLSFKRASVERFVRQIDASWEKNSAVLIFGNREEAEIKNELSKQLRKKHLIVDADLKKVAALILNCKLFITNDTGLMHIASTGFDTQIVAFFCGSNPKRTRPFGKKNKLIILKDSIMRYPFYATKN